MSVLTKWWNGKKEVSANYCPKCQEPLKGSKFWVGEDGVYHFECYEEILRRETFLKLIQNYGKKETSPKVQEARNEMPDVR